MSKVGDSQVFFKEFSTVGLMVSALAMTACGGTSFSTYSNYADVGEDLTNQTDIAVPSRAYVEVDIGNSIRRDNPSLQFISFDATTIVARVNGDTVTMTWNAVDQRFEGTIGGDSVFFQALYNGSEGADLVVIMGYSGRFNTATGDGSYGYVTFGLPTDPTAIATSGTANYLGFGELMIRDETSPAFADLTVSIDVNFADGTLDGGINILSSTLTHVATIDIPTTSITGNEFSTTGSVLDADATDGLTFGGSMTTDGTFFGATGGILAGATEGTVTINGFSYLSVGGYVAAQ